MGNKSSWRFKWVDIDSSFTIQQPEEGAIKGYMVVRSPKGTTEAKLFPRGNAEAIRAYVGLETANFPDISEAIAFNREYDIYLSCPPGSSAEYPSYLGGMYLTSEGLKPFYNVTNKTTVDFTQNKNFNADEFGDKFNIRVVGNPSCSKGKSDFAYVISGIPTEKWANLQELGLDFWGDENLGIPASMYYYTINKADHKIYIEDEDYQPVTDFYCGIWYKSKEGYNIVIGGQDWLPQLQTEPMFKDFFNMPIATSLGLNLMSSNNTSDNTICPYFSIDALRSNAKTLALESKRIERFFKIKDSGESGSDTETTEYVPVQNTASGGSTWSSSQAIWLELLTSIGCSWYEDDTNNTENSEVSLYEYYKDFLRFLRSSDTKFLDENVYGGNINVSTYEGNTFLPDSFTINIDDVTRYYELGDTQVSLLGKLTALINIKDTVYGYIMQKYPTETPTTVVFENIGYDKYIYDDTITSLCYGDSSAVNKIGITQDFVEKLGTNKLFITHRINSDGKYTSFSGECIWYFDEALFDKNLKEGDNHVELKDCCTKVQQKQISNRLLVEKTLFYTENSGDYVYTIDDSTSSLTDHILFVQSKTKVLVQVEENADSNLELKKDVNYNTITFSCSEEVIPGQITSGGTITGSLSETGKDSSGGNIYFPNILNEDDFSFVDFVPVKTFDEDLNNQGIFTKQRIVDDQIVVDKTGHTVGKTYKINLKGQRYINEVVRQNIKNGVIGGTWNDGFYGAVLSGWEEAFSKEYDDVYIFMDPTGQEFVHTQHASLVQEQKLAIAISPKLITQAEFKNVSQITVTGRHQQCAQFVGEFKVYDSYTGQYYWCNPIGDVGLNCARIFDIKLGGWAPAWFNYGGVGGQLNRNVVASRWKFTDKDTEILDKKGINPIVYNKDDGLMIVSQKTLQDPNNLTDWGYLGHTMSFVMCKREIRDTIMRPQIMKPIDDFWFEVRQEQLDTVLNKRLTGATRIWTAAKGEVASVNNDNTKMQNKFCLKVRVKVTKFSEIVELSLETVNQTVVL